MSIFDDLDAYIASRLDKRTRRLVDLGGLEKITTDPQVRAAKAARGTVGWMQGLGQSFTTEEGWGKFFENSLGASRLGRQAGQAFVASHPGNDFSDYLNEDVLRRNNVQELVLQRIQDPNRRAQLLAELRQSQPQLNDVLPDSVTPASVVGNAALTLSEALPIGTALMRGAGHAAKGSRAIPLSAVSKIVNKPVRVIDTGEELARMAPGIRYEAGMLNHSRLPYGVTANINKPIGPGLIDLAKGLRQAFFPTGELVQNRALGKFARGYKRIQKVKRR